jgi:HmuY protein
MKKSLFALLITTVTLSIFLTSCEEEDNPLQANEGIITIDASDYGSWVYFSFEKDTIVEITDYKTSLDWDLGFHRYDLRVNCGESGNGEGGTNGTGIINFDEITIAPESGYSVNDSIEIAVDIASFPPLMETVPGDTLLATWIEMTYGASGPEYSYSNEVFVIKTSEGKYAKIWLKDYFNDESKSGFVTMKYSYQSDGSKKLD